LDFGIGGMPELARGLAEAMQVNDDVVVYTRVNSGIVASTYRQEPILTCDLYSDARRLARENVDAWYAMNAGFVPLAPKLCQPFFAYFHGSDFLRPWVGYKRLWLKVVNRVPYLQNQATMLGTSLRQGDIRRGLHGVARLFTNSRFTAELIQQTFPNHGLDIETIPPGVDASYFQQKEEAEDKISSLRILTVTRLTKYSRRKNVDGVLEALGLIGSSLPFRYTVVGDGDDRPRLEGLARDLGIYDSVHFLGRVTHNELLACYRKADLFILASKATPLDVEGFGIVYLEAAASGVPAICSRKGGSVDAVKDGWNGILIPTSSPQDIGAGIIRFVNSREQFPPRRVQSFAELFRWPSLALRTRERIASFVHDSRRRRFDPKAYKHQF